MTISALNIKFGVRILRPYPGVTLVGTIAMAVATALGMLYFEGLTKALYPDCPGRW